ncbi:hypothetical protein SLUN_01500 [Streptomyces lunaelactis]|uniref:Uncharacterized protein n=1 Tax=Streptomyces lunaelactis TaxID=1535768 RepID=A0A2R4SW69_9ACTN|nr:hypothetical protein SLUN_01500 [Streptomyces lunaelactis]
MAAPGEYARAERMAKQEQRRPVLTADVNRRMLAAFAASGWPTHAERRFAESGLWNSWIGPAAVLLGRPGHNHSGCGSGDPDEADLYEVPTIGFSAPSLLEPSVYLQVLGTEEPVAIVEQVEAALAEGRAQLVATLVGDGECAICGDAYPRGHLLMATDSEALRVCPACVFAGDLVNGAFPEQLTVEFDGLLFQDLALPAGWAAVAALLACAGAAQLGPVVNEAWKRVLWAPGAHWSDAMLWIWLPPVSRPWALDGLGAGASLAAVVDAVERAHPGLQDLYRATLREYWPRMRNPRRTDRGRRRTI